jgi:hypothetical protein
MNHTQSVTIGTDGSVVGTFTRGVVGFFVDALIHRRYCQSTFGLTSSFK